MNKLSIVYIGLGSNLGNRALNISNAFQQIQEKIGIIEAKSSLYLSPPWGFEAKEDFYNAVIKIKTTFDPLTVLKMLKEIELNLGRVKVLKSGYQSRSIDLDIIDFGGIILTTDELELPHPQMQNRKFVLFPLDEIEQNWVHPITLETTQALLKRIESTDFIQKLEETID